MANNLGITNPTIGGSYDTWGTLNDANIAAINKAFGDILTLTDTSGTVTLSQSQSNYAAMKFTGSGASLVTVAAIDDIGRLWFVNNARASGSVKFQCADGLGTSVTLAAGDKRFLYSDGTDVIDATVATLAISGVTGLQAALDAKQASDTDLTAIAALTSAANKIPYATGAGTWALADFPAAARTAFTAGFSADVLALLDDANFAAMRTSLGLAIGTNVQAYSAILAAYAAGSAAAGAASTYGLFQTAAIVSAGATTAGSNLVYAKFESTGALKVGVTHPSGTWRNMSDAAVAVGDVSVFLRSA